MWKLVWPILLSLGPFGCSPRDALPVLSVRGMTVLHDRSGVPTRGQRVDYALSVQLAFNPGVRDRRRHTSDLERDPQLATEPLLCSDAALCSWADAAELAVLAQLGVLP